VSCTKDTLRCPEARNYGKVLPECCRGHLRRMMADFQESCARHGVRWWADYGTLLGAVRNPLTTAEDYPWLDGLPDGPLAPGIVPHDKDCDLGAYRDDWLKMLKVWRDLKKMGYHVKARNQSASLKIHLSTMNLTNIDVFTWKAAGDGVMKRLTYIGADRYKGKAFPGAWLVPLSTVEWEGMTLPAPADPAAFCAFRYGDSWMTPIPANHDGVPR
jgi:phosphorylcholine metabolism protein LicD